MVGVLAILALLQGLAVTSQSLVLSFNLTIGCLSFLLLQLIAVLIFVKFWCTRDSKGSRSDLKWACSLTLLSILLEVFWIPTFILLLETPILTEKIEERYKASEYVDYV